jgi:hypothetical protein
MDQLVMQITRCFEIAQAESHDSHPCSNVVRLQHQEARHVPEPWNGDLLIYDPENDEGELGGGLSRWRRRFHRRALATASRISGNSTSLIWHGLADAVRAMRRLLVAEAPRYAAGGLSVCQWKPSAGPHKRTEHLGRDPSGVSLLTYIAGGWLSKRQSLARNN